MLSYYQVQVLGCDRGVIPTIGYTTTSERDFVSKNEPNRLKNGETPAKNVSQVQKQ